MDFIKVYLFLIISNLSNASKNPLMNKLDAKYEYDQPLLSSDLSTF